VFDGHVDLVHALRQVAEENFAALREGPVTPGSLQAGGVRLLASALYCADRYNGPPASAHLAELLAADRRLQSSLAPVSTRGELAAAWGGSGPPGRLLLLENADALLEFGVASACAAGIVSVGLTHAGRNRLADGNAVASPGGLTAAGKRLLMELMAAGRVIDVAHLAAPGFWQVLAECEGPLICSHTGLCHFCNRPRNLADNQLAALLGRGGMVGLAFAPELLAEAGEVDLEAAFRQLDWLVQRFGPNRVGLGSDFGGFDGVCRGLEDHARLPALAERLQRAGYPAAATTGIMGDNWRRFYTAVLPAG
jgi:membrane dipeptidase